MTVADSGSDSDSGGADLETRRVGVFLAVAFGIAVAVGVAIHATGGLADSPRVAPGVPITFATVLIATVYMFSPAVANVVTRLVTREGWRDLRLRPRFRAHWRTYLLAWLGPPALIVAGAGAYFAVSPAAFDPGASAVGAATGVGVGGGAGSASDPWTVIALAVGAALTVGTLVNSVVAFGEEFGWRAYLLPKLLPLGVRRAVVAHGVIWGAWHWPVIAMGYNYGLAYPGAPWLGLAAMAWATVAIGAFLAWVTLRADSVWPAAVGHAALNAFGGIPLLFVRGDPLLLLGPIPVGVVGSLGFVAVAAWLLARPSRLVGGVGGGDAERSPSVPAE